MTEDYLFKIQALEVWVKYCVHEKLLKSDTNEVLDRLYMGSHIFFPVNFFLSIIWESTVVGSWCSGSKWLKPAKTKLTLGDLTIFSQQVSSDPFPIILCASFSKFVKLLQE